MLKQNIKHLQVIVDEKTAHEMNADVFLRLVRKYNNINALTPEILREFIDKIIVYHREQEYGQTVQDVEIFYRFIGYIKLPEMTTAQKERLIEIFGRDDKEKGRVKSLPKQQKNSHKEPQVPYGYSYWLRGKDLNLRPSGYEPDELPTAPPRDIKLHKTHFLSARYSIQQIGKKCKSFFTNILYNRYSLQY